MGLLLFLIYINDISTNIQSNCYLYANDTSLFQVVNDPSLTAASINQDLIRIQSWARDWLVTINARKTKSIIFSTKRNKPQHQPRFYDNAHIDDVYSHKHLGVTLSSNLSWKPHILNIYEKATKFFEGIKI